MLEMENSSYIYPCIVKYGCICSCKEWKDYVREAQQYLNNTYIVKLSNWALIPCNGIPDRNMMKAIIAGLQYEEANHSTSGVDGIYGKNTLSKAPTLSSGTAKTAYVKIVQNVSDVYDGDKCRYGWSIWKCVKKTD